MTQIGDNRGAQLVSFVERIERLAEEKQALQDDMKEVFDEAKSAGFDTAIMRKVIALRKIPAEQRDEREQLIDLYMATLDRFEQQAVKKSLEQGS